MTYIPGTGQLKKSTEKDNQEFVDPEKSNLFTYVNVKEAKNPTVVEIQEKEWYLQLKTWIIVGSVFSLIFAILAFNDWRLVFLLPVGPYVGYLSWHIRKWIKKHSEKFDALS